MARLLLINFLCVSAWAQYAMGESGESQAKEKDSVVKHFEYIVVGAGPGGLQMGYFLDRAGRDYVIMERSAIPGSFFEIYPRHGRLISINKRHTGSKNTEFNLRHDWNSLLSDNDTLRFTKYSKDFFPLKEDYVKYLSDYAEMLKLKIQFNTDICNITRNEASSMKKDKFKMADQHGVVYTCSYLIIATGLGSPTLLPSDTEQFVEGYETVSTDPNDFEGQSVLILGRGNAAYEVADSIYGSTSVVHLIGRSRVRLAWSTHYVGDLRAVNNALLDTYQLKSLDGMLEAPMEKLKIIKKGSKYQVGSVDDENEIPYSSREFGSDNFALRKPYDRIIRCLGFKFNDTIFNSDEMSVSVGKGRKAKYPKITYAYESVDTPDMYFVGTATHSLDFRKSAGGFIHGFRYTTRALHRLLEWKNHEKAWPKTSGHVTDLLAVVLKRINEASGLYQMYSVLCDVIAIRGDTFDYFEEFPVNLLHEFDRYSGHPRSAIIAVTLDYGANFSGPGEDVFREDRATGDPSDAARSNFLHPVFYYYNKLPTRTQMRKRASWETLPKPDILHHTVEDFLTSWDTPISHVLPLRRFIEACLDTDLRNYYAEDCLQFSFTHLTFPASCHRLSQPVALSQVNATSDNVGMTTEANSEIRYGVSLAGKVYSEL